MAKHNVYVAVDHAHGYATNSAIMESLIASAPYEDVHVQAQSVIFSGGHPEEDVRRWYAQGQTKVSIIHVECDQVGVNHWNVALNFYGNRKLSARVTKDKKIRYTFRNVPGAIVTEMLKGIAAGGFPVMKLYGNTKLVRYAG